MAVVGDGLLTFRNSVPQLNSLVTTSRDDLTVVWAESYTVHVLSVAVEDTNGFGLNKIPEPEGTIYVIIYIYMIR